MRKKEIVLSGILLCAPLFMTQSSYAMDITETTDWFKTDKIITMIQGADTGGSGTKEVRYQVDGGAWQPYVAPLQLTQTQKISMMTVDNATNESEKRTVLVRIDKVAPNSPILQVSGKIANTPITVQLTDGPDTGGSGVAKSQIQVQSVGVAASDSDWQDYGGEIMVSAEGSYVAYGRTLDVAGNISALTTSVEFVIDMTPPDKIEIAPGDVSNGGKDQNEVVITVPDATDSSDKVDFTVVKRDDSVASGTWNPVLDNKVTVTDEGNWDVYIKVTDPAGNETITGPIHVIIDRTAPTEPVITPSAQLANTPITYTITPGTDNGVGVDRTAYRVLNSVDSTVISDWATYSAEQSVAAEGKYRVEAKTIDQLANISPVASVEFVIDMTPPDKIEIAPGDVSNGGKDQNEVVITVPDATDPSDQVDFTVVKRDDPMASGTWNPVLDNKVTVTDEGNWDVYIKVTDPAGNETITGPIHVIIDRTAPTEPVITPSAQLANAPITYTITPGTDNGSGVDRTAYRVLNSVDSTVISDWATYSAEQSVAAEGKYRVEAKTIDQLANISPVASVEFVIDMTPPDKIEIAPGDVSNGGKDQNEVVITVPDATDLSDQVDFTVVKRDDAMASGTWNPVLDNKVTVTDEGNWDVYIKVTDPAGNETITGPIHVTIDRSGPGEITFKGLLPDEWSKATRFTVSAQDDISSVAKIYYWFSFDTNKHEAQSAPISASIDSSGMITAYEDYGIAIPDGEYVIYAQGEDEFHNLGVESSINVKIDSQDPTLTMTEQEQYDDAFEITLMGEDTLRDAAITDVSSGVEKILYTLATNEKGALPLDQTYIAPIKCADEGAYDLSATAYDHAGNQSILQKKSYYLDKTSPIISDVQVTGGQVTIVANDKTALQYSFDGGVSWQTEKDKTYMHNTHFPVGQLQVQDAVGHSTIWQKTVSVTFPSRDDDSIDESDNGSVKPPDVKSEIKDDVLNTTGGLDQNGKNLYFTSGISTKNSQMTTGYIVGYEDGNFRAYNDITRAETAAFLYRVLDFEDDKAWQQYQDVPTEFWAARDIAVVQGHQLIPTNGRFFEPNAPMTREALAVTLDHLLMLDDYTAPPILQDVSTSRYQGEIERVVRAGLMETEKDDTFNAYGTINRAEMVNIFNHLLGLDLKGLTKKPAFKDVQKSDWYYDDVSKASVEDLQKM